MTGAMAIVARKVSSSWENRECSGWTAALDEVEELSGMTPAVVLEASPKMVKAYSKEASH